MTTPPPPRHGGSRIFCPMVDLQMTGEADELRMCQWAGRNTRNDRRRYRQHWRRDHWAPFTAGTHALMEYLVKGDWLGFKNVPARVRVYK